MKYFTFILAIVTATAGLANENKANMTMTIFTDNDNGPVRPLGNPTGQDYRFTVEPGDGQPNFYDCDPSCNVEVDPKD